MIFSSKTEIRGYYLSSKILFPIARNLKQVVGVGYDGEHVYWTDIFAENEAIMRSLEDGSQKEVRTQSRFSGHDFHLNALLTVDSNRRIRRS